MPVAGDTVTLTRTSSADEVLLDLVDPDDATSTLTATADGEAWTALVVVDSPGEWLYRWRDIADETETVTGYTPLAVAPDPTDTDADPVTYATTADLARYLKAAPPSGARRMLVRASAHVDRLLLCARYATDDTGYPTDVGVAAALRDAVCAQVRWWSDTGDDTGVIAAGGGAAIGSVRITTTASGTTPSVSVGQTAPDCWAILTTAGLLGFDPVLD